MQPLANLVAKLSDAQRAELRGTELQTTECAAEKRDGAAAIPRSQVMKRSAHLNQRLEETLFRFGESEPDALPMFMGLEKLLRAIAAQPLSQAAGSPVESCAHVQTRWRVLHVRSKPDPGGCTPLLCKEVCWFQQSTELISPQISPPVELSRRVVSTKNLQAIPERCDPVHQLKNMQKLRNLLEGHPIRACKSLRLQIIASLCAKIPPISIVRQTTKKPANGRQIFRQIGGEPPRLRRAQ